MWTDAWQSSVYKHMVAANAKETTEGYSLAGKYSLVGVYGSFLFTVPVSLAMSWWMPAIMLWIGYDEEIVDISRSYAFIYSISQVSSYGLYSLYSLLEIGDWKVD